LKTIITVAITGAQTTKEQTQYLPITPEEIANSSLEAAEAGAAIVHIHVRDPQTGKPSMNIDYYKDVVERIKKQNEKVLINLTTGAGALFIPDWKDLNKGSEYSKMFNAEERVKHIQLIKPDICSLDFNTMHQAKGDGIRINLRRITKEMLRLVQEAGTKPEMEIFDSGDFRIAQEFVDEGLVKGKPFYQFVMGVKYGWGASTNTLQYALKELRSNATWSAFGIGKDEMPMVAQSIILGGHVRVGLEDNIYTSKGVLAKSNAELVIMAKDIIRLLGGQVASPSDARDILF
jgi:uncharacterized protein (DUF849 family)